MPLQTFQRKSHSLWRCRSCRIILFRCGNTCGKATLEYDLASNQPTESPSKSPTMKPTCIKCTGSNACTGISPSTVPCGSCNGQRSCYGTTNGAISPGSCNGIFACTNHICESRIVFIIIPPKFSSRQALTIYLLSDKVGVNSWCVQYKRYRTVLCFL